MSELSDVLDLGNAPEWSPIDNVTLTVHGLNDSGPHPVLFSATVETDDGMLVSNPLLELVGVTENTFYVADESGRPASRVHDDAHDAIEASGGQIVDDKSEVPQ